MCIGRTMALRTLLAAAINAKGGAADGAAFDMAIMDMCDAMDPACWDALDLLCNAANKKAATFVAGIKPAADYNAAEVA